ncbi:MAG: sugar ABC transporter permease [Treponema sp.]|nr:sugar ABC transporter permease [Treponema sp.]
MKYNIVDPQDSTFVGFANFMKLFGDEYIWKSILNTVYYTVGTLGIGIVLSLLIALLICEPWFKLQGMARALLFVPYIMSMVISGLVWSYIYQPDFGILNLVLGKLHLPEQKLLGQPRVAMWAVIIMVIWRDLGYRITIWSAGILSISRDYTEAARIDGANWLQEVLLIKLPLLRPVAMFLTVLGIIGSFQAFESVYVLTSGGPARATEVIVYNLWREAFAKNNIGYASAIAWLLFVILISFTLLQMKLLYGEEEGN